MILIPGGRKRDTQMAPNGSFWNTKDQCLHHRMSLCLAMSNFTMMVRLYFRQVYLTSMQVKMFTVELCDNKMPIFAYLR